MMRAMRAAQLLTFLIPTTLASAQSLDHPDVPTGLYERRAGEIVNASREDFAVAKTYHLFQNKGQVKDGQRITILTAKLEYKVGEPVRVLHVLESVKPGIDVYVMGPKKITDEYIDGRLSAPEGPLLGAYDGAVINRPIADFNYDITTYTFANPGLHTIQWRSYGGLGNKDRPLQSNTIKLNIVQK
jgi:hypothetical protein